MPLQFIPTDLAGLMIVAIEAREDERGLFARTFCRDEFRAAGLPDVFVQCNISFNAHAGTLRGMHFQAEPYEEEKLVRCTVGAIFDVSVDLRPGSATYGRWQGVELTQTNRRALFVPGGFAHGFVTLTDGAEVFYQMSTPYVAEAARGVRWNDPAFAIKWPIANPILSERDASYPDHKL